MIIAPLLKLLRSGREAWSSVYPALLQARLLIYPIASFLARDNSKEVSRLMLQDLAAFYMILVSR